MARQERGRSQICSRRRRLSVAVLPVVTVCLLPLPPLPSTHSPPSSNQSIRSITDAGHTIVHNSTTYDFHILPSGLISPSCINLIGAGTVVHVPSFFKELAALEEKGLENASKRVFISDRAHVCLDLHSVVEGLEEAKLGGRKVGTTGKGIGPCYSDKAARRGIRIGEILQEEVFERKIRSLHAGYTSRFGQLEYDLEGEIGRFKVCCFFHVTDGVC